MRSATLFLAFLLCSWALKVDGQQTQDTTRSRWSLGFTLGAGMGYRTLYTTNSSETNAAIIDSRNDREKADPAYASRAVVHLRLNEHFGIQAGLGYFQLGWGYEQNLSGLTFGDQIDPRRGFIYQTDDVLPKKWNFSDRFHYLELPVGVTLSLGGRRWRSVSALGIAPAILISAQDRVKGEYADGREALDVRDITAEFNTFNLFPYFSTGVAFKAWDRWELRLQPMVRYGVLRIIEAPITARLFMGQVDVGVGFTL